MRSGGRIAFLGGGVGERVILADKDADGDFDVLTAAAWESVTKSGTGTINWNTAFGVPAGAKAVFVSMFGCHSSPDVNFTLRAKSTTSNASLLIVTLVANLWFPAHGLVAIAADGTSYYWFGGTWDWFFLRVVGWIV